MLCEPQVLVKFVVSGGVVVTTVAGAVPNEIPDVGVPPEICDGTKGLVPVPSSNHVVTKVSVVEPSQAAVIRT